MKISEFSAHVEMTDLASDKSNNERETIALYGIFGEVGSLVSALKKQQKFSQRLCASEEVIEELGDLLWYCFAFARNQRVSVLEALRNDVRELRKDMNGDRQQTEYIRRHVPDSNRARFLSSSGDFLEMPDVELADYQRLVVDTARTKGDMLVEVCIAVLSQLTAELMRRRLPDFERGINRNLPDREPVVVLGEIFWHIAALCEVMRLSLDEVAVKNIEKLVYLGSRDATTKLHDEGFPEPERFPRRFEIAFLSIGEKLARMYLGSNQLGDDLSDNIYELDGYRYHDVMHLANAAILGWSPVLRSLMKVKRKSDAKIDEVEDGARAKIVEELVIKYIHTEGSRVAGARHPSVDSKHLQLFEEESDFSYRLWRSVLSLVEKRESASNTFWEWQRAVREGHRIFNRLREEQQGTVTVDLIERTIAFRPTVDINFRGRIVKVGRCASVDNVDLCIRNAVLNALDLDCVKENEEAIIIERINERTLVRTAGGVRSRQQSLGVAIFRVEAIYLCGGWNCTALGLGD